MKKFRRTKTVVPSAVALVIAALVFILVSVRHRPHKDAEVRPHLGHGLHHHEHHLQLPHQPDRALLYPGVQRYLWYTAHNPMTVPITVTSMSIATVTPPAGCPTSNLDLQLHDLLRLARGPAIGHERRVGAHLTHRHRHATRTRARTRSSTSSTRARPPTQRSTPPRRQSSPLGVTYTATVTASATSTQDPVPSSPTGTVTFSDGSTTFCTGVPLTSTGTTTSTATCGPIPGGDTVTAVYTNTDGNFTDSSGTGS